MKYAFSKNDVCVYSESNLKKVKIKKKKLYKKRLA